MFVQNLLVIYCMNQYYQLYFTILIFVFQNWENNANCLYFNKLDTFLFSELNQHKCRNKKQQICLYNIDNSFWASKPNT